MWTYQVGAQPRTRFRPGSVTKTFTAVLVLQCRDDGLLDLDDPIGRHLDLPRHGELAGTAAAVAHLGAATGTVRRHVGHAGRAGRGPAAGRPGPGGTGTAAGPAAPLLAPGLRPTRAPRRPPLRPRPAPAPPAQRPPGTRGAAGRDRGRPRPAARRPGPPHRS